MERFFTSYPAGARLGVALPKIILFIFLLFSDPNDKYMTHMVSNYMSHNISHHMTHHMNHL